jgi:hypothetical protein
MRTIPALALLAVAGVAGTARADEREAVALVERAIKAHGGEARLARAQLCTRRESGTQVVMGKDVPISGEVVRNLPEQVRLSLEVAKALKIVVVVNGDKGWERVAGPAVELVKPRLQELREEAYVLWLTTLVPLKKGGFTLDTAPEVKVNGEAAAGVKVSRKGQPDATLYFSKRTGLLVRIARRAREAGVLVDKEYTFSDFKDFDGTKLPAKELTTHNGVRWTEINVSSYTFLARPDPNAFTRP